MSATKMTKVQVLAENAALREALELARQREIELRNENDALRRTHTALESEYQRVRNMYLYKLEKEEADQTPKAKSEPAWVTARKAAMAAAREMAMKIGRSVKMGA